MKLELIEYVKEPLPAGAKPYSIYSILVNEKEIGRLVLREGDDQECYYDGHIGYHIYEEYRGHHYAYQACLLLKEMIDKDHVIITCNPTNIASKKTIESLGCEYLETKRIPQHLKKLFASDEYEKMIYRWNITS